MVKKAKPKLATFTLTVVGFKYRLSKIELGQLAKLVEKEDGIPCKFELEPENPVDVYAVKVIASSRYTLFSGIHLGYVRRPVNVTIFKLLRRKAEVKLALLTYVDVDAGEGELEVAVLQPSE